MKSKAINFSALVTCCCPGAAESIYMNWMAGYYYIKPGNINCIAYTIKKASK